MAEKKYYWLKLMKDFFTQPKIKKLRRIAGGDTYTLIYLKLQLLSLENEGMLCYQGIEDNFVEEMALTIDEDVENVNVTVNYLMAQGLLDQVDDNEYLLTETIQLIGSETSVAKRVRKHRDNQKALQCNATVTSSNAIETTCNTEIEKELEIEIESEIELDIPYREIIDYLNSKIGTSYKSTTKKTQSLIKARFNEGFTLDDFIKAIDNKVAEWRGTDMEKFLRPETLFGTKFESYLNQKPKPMTANEWMNKVLRGEIVLDEQDGNSSDSQIAPLSLPY